MPIGFIHFPGPKTAQSPAPTVLTETPPDALHRFDNGHIVTFADGTHNTLILGTTGSGKTHSAMLPALDRLVRAGFGGVVVDSKGSLAPYVRAIATVAGRAEDIVEAGPYDTAARFDILAGCNPAEQEAILDALLLSYIGPNDHNAYFHKTGLHQFAEIVDVSRRLCRRTGIPFGMHIPVRAVHDSQYALRLLQSFKSAATGGEDEALIRSIEASSTHLMPRDAQTMGTRVWQEQTAYFASPVRTGWGILAGTPGLVANFFGAGGQPFNPETLVFDGHKILLLRLSPEAGEAGAGICRLLLRRYYAAAYKRGRSLPDGQYSFLLADEFQDYVSTAPSDPLNDALWLAKCREFRAVTLLGTQSATALAQRAVRGMEDVRAMLGNCNCRVYLYSDDPETCRLAETATPTPLHRLAPGQCVLAAYDTQTRRHVACLTSMNRQYQALRPVLEQAVQTEDASPPPETETERRAQRRLQEVLAADPIVEEGTSYAESKAAMTALLQLEREAPLDDVVALYREAAMDGETCAMKRLATLFDAGRGVKQSFSSAEFWLRRAAEIGDVDAVYRLARHYERRGQVSKAASVWKSLAKVYWKDIYKAGLNSA